MKKAKGGEYAPRDKPKKRPGKHKKSLNKAEKLQNRHKKYHGQGRGWHTILFVYYPILYNTGEIWQTQLNLKTFA